MTKRVIDSGFFTIGVLELDGEAIEVEAVLSEFCRGDELKKANELLKSMVGMRPPTESIQTHCDALNESHHLHKWVLA